MLFTNPFSLDTLTTPPPITPASLQAPSVPPTQPQPFSPTSPPQPSAPPSPFPTSQAAKKDVDDAWAAAQEWAEQQAAPPAKEARPNLLFMIADDLDAFSRQHTPNLDAFEKRAVSFRRAYANHPWCAPSRDSFLTGHMRFGHEDDYYKYRERSAAEIASGWAAATGQNRSSVRVDQLVEDGGNCGPDNGHKVCRHCCSSATGSTPSAGKAQNVCVSLPSNGPHPQQDAVGRASRRIQAQLPGPDTIAAGHSAPQPLPDPCVENSLGQASAAPHMRCVSGGLAYWTATVSYGDHGVRPSDPHGLFGATRLCVHGPAK